MITVAAVECDAAGGEHTARPQPAIVAAFAT
jgi:hypothetical protein